MEIIKKTILLATTTGTTTGCTGTCRIIVPDLNANYNIKFLLSSDVRDLGFFDVYSEPQNYYNTNNDGLISFDYPIGIENLL